MKNFVSVVFIVMIFALTGTRVIAFSHGNSGHGIYLINANGNLLINANGNLLLN